MKKALRPHWIGLALACLAAGATRQDFPLDARGPIGYYIGPGEGIAGYRTGDEILARWAMEAWEKAAGGAFTVKPARRESALLQLYWVSGREGLYGEMVPIVVGEERGAAIHVLPDTRALGDEIARRSDRDPLFRDSVVYLTCLHELGHGLGLSHTDDYADIMYYFGYGGDVPEYFQRYRKRLKSRGDIGRVSGLSKNDALRLRTIYRRRPRGGSEPELHE